MIKFIVSSSFVGLIVPILFSLIWMLLEKHPHAYHTMGGLLLDVQLLLWPSSFLMLGAAGSKKIEYEMFVFSTGINILLYALLGVLLWWGQNKQQWVLYLTIGLIVLIWYNFSTFFN